MTDTSPPIPAGSRPQGPPGTRPPGIPSSAAGPEIDTQERGAPIDGEAQVLDRRLFVQFLALTVTNGEDPTDTLAALSASLTDGGVPSVIYEDINDPKGLGLVTWSEDPSHFVERVRPVLNQPGLRNTQLRPDFTMLGRTYSSGYESDLAWWLIERPQNTMLNEDWPWAVWYPLRRGGGFARLEPKEQGAILREHAVLGRAYGSADLAHDVRLACHGLDARDNEFVIGLLGAKLQPLSHLIQAMRKTRQTSEYITSMGPFFVGRAIWRNGPSDGATTAD